MLTDLAIRNLKPRDKAYKVADRDGMYLVISPMGNRTFRFDYRFNGRRETLTIGRYPDLPLTQAREALIEARRGKFVTVFRLREPSLTVNKAGAIPSRSATTRLCGSKTRGWPRAPRPCASRSWTATSSRCSESGSWRRFGPPS